MSIEEEFFKTFGIEPRNYYSCNIDSYCPFNSNLCDENCPYWEKYKTAYPEITDRILLELMCIIIKSKALLPIFISGNVEGLKEEILQMLIKIETKFKHNSKIDVKHQVRSLFEGVEE